jgi:hypothetical protein
MSESKAGWRKITRRQKAGIIFAIALVGFLSCVLPLSLVHVYEMGSSNFFIFEITPLAYWFGIALIASSAFLMLYYVSDEKYVIPSVILSIILLISIRMVFAITFVNPINYEPDIANYLNVLNSWVTSGINFGVAGNYQHDFPLAYLIGYVLLKFGIPIYSLFSLVPLFIYALDAFLIFLIVKAVTGNSKVSCTSVFIFSLSPLNQWIAVHFCPDLVGSLFFLLSLYLVIRGAKMKRWDLKSVALECTCIFALILAHHLSTLYLIFALLGLALATKIFKSPGTLHYLIMGIYTYTLWFAYGNLMYPNFFNLANYLGFTGTPATASAQAPLLVNATFVIYPLLVLSLFIFGFLNSLNIRRISDVFKLIKEVKNLTWIPKIIPKYESAEAFPIVYTFGFILVVFLFLVGLLVPTIFGLRVLEVLTIGALPMASRAFLKAANPSKKKKIIIFCIILFVTFTSIYRFYNEIQRRVLIG